MKIEEAYKMLGECFEQIKVALAEENRTVTQGIVLEALSLARPTDVGTAGCIASMLKTGEIPPGLASRIYNSRLRPWDNYVCSEAWGIPPTEEAMAEWNVRKRQIEDFDRLKAVVFPDKDVPNYEVPNRIVELAGHKSQGAITVRKAYSVPFAVSDRADEIRLDIQDTLDPLVLTAGMYCGQVELLNIMERNGDYFAVYGVTVGTTRVVFKAVGL